MLGLVTELVRDGAGGLNLESSGSKAIILSTTPGAGGKRGECAVGAGRSVCVSAST